GDRLVRRVGLRDRDPIELQPGFAGRAGVEGVVLLAAAAQVEYWGKARVREEPDLFGRGLSADRDAVVDAMELNDRLHAGRREDRSGQGRDRQRQDHFHSGTHDQLLSRASRTKSDSVRIPTRCSPSTTGRQPILFSRSISAATRSLSSGSTVST